MTRKRESDRVVRHVTALNYEWMPAVLFLVYLLYGLVRPWVSKTWQREIEEEIGEEPPGEATAEESP